MASATPSASVPGKSTSAPEERGVGGPRRHAEWPQGADAVIAAAMRSSVRLAAPNDHEFTKTNDTSCIPSSSVTILRNMLESCDNCARSEKRHGKMFRRHAEWPKVADAVIEATDVTSKSCASPPVVILVVLSCTVAGGHSPGTGLSGLVWRGDGLCTRRRRGRRGKRHCDPVFGCADAAR